MPKIILLEEITANEQLVLRASCTPSRTASRRREAVKSGKKTVEDEEEYEDHLYGNKMIPKSRQWNRGGSEDCR